VLKDAATKTSEERRMARAPLTWIVGAPDDDGFATRCLLELEQRFTLPEDVTVAHGRRGADAQTERGRVLTFLPDPPGAARDFLGLLREREAATALQAAGTRACPHRAVAVGVARGRDNAVDDAVHLAVTTLIDWGHEIVHRPARG
jgi:hypothetical protein